MHFCAIASQDSTINQSLPLQAPAQIEPYSSDDSRSLEGPAKEPVLTLALLSDTHNRVLPVPAADVLIHAGDLTENGTYQELEAQLIFIIGGNHDRCLDPFYVENTSLSPEMHRQYTYEHQQATELLTILQSNGLIFLQDYDEGYLYRGMCFYGDSSSPNSGDGAFQYSITPHDGEPSTGEEIWSNIPDNVDILITHTPARGVLDGNYAGDAVGCPELQKKLASVGRLPMLHVCGHIHHAAGIQYDSDSGRGAMVTVNAACHSLLGGVFVGDAKQPAHHVSFKCGDLILE